MRRMCKQLIKWENKEPMKKKKTYTWPSDRGGERIQDLSQKGERTEIAIHVTFVRSAFTFSPFEIPEDEDENYSYK